jgi:hypothetical protein
MSEIIFKDDFIIVRKQTKKHVSVAVGNPPEKATPTIVESGDLLESLKENVEDKKRVESLETYPTLVMGND